MASDKQDKISDNAYTMLAAPTMFRQLALPLQPGDSVKWQIQRAAREAGFSARRAKSLWYGTCELWAKEYAQLCAAYERYLNRYEKNLENEIAIIRARRTQREIERRQHALPLTEARPPRLVAREGMDLETS